MGSLSSSNSTLLSMLMNSPKSLLSNYKLPQHQYSLSDSKRDIFVPLFTILTLQLTNKRRTAVGESHILSFGEVLSRCHAYAIGCRSVFREFLHRTYSSPKYFKNISCPFKGGFSHSLYENSLSASAQRRVRPREVDFHGISYT